MRRGGAGMVVVGFLACAPGPSMPLPPEQGEIEAPREPPADASPIPFSIDWPLPRSDLLGADVAHLRGRAEPGVSVLVDGALARSDGDGWFLDVPIPSDSDFELVVRGLRDMTFSERRLQLHNSQPVGRALGLSAWGGRLWALHAEHILSIDPKSLAVELLVPVRETNDAPLDESMIDLAASEAEVFVLTEQALYAGEEGPSTLRRVFRFPESKPARRVFAAPGGERLVMLLADGEIFEHDAVGGRVRRHVPAHDVAIAVSDEAVWLADGERLMRGAPEGGAPEDWMELPLEGPAEHLFLFDESTLGVLDGAALLRIDVDERRIERVPLPFAPAPRSAFVEDSLWLQPRATAEPAELIALEPTSGDIQHRLGASSSPRLGLFSGVVDGPGASMVARADGLLFPRSDRDAMLAWSFEEAQATELPLPEGGPFVAFEQGGRDVALAGPSQAWVWRTDAEPLPRPSFEGACDRLDQATAMASAWVALCDERVVAVRPRAALSAARYPFEQPLRALAAGTRGRVWLADDSSIFEWDIEQQLRLRSRGLPPGLPELTALASLEETLFVAFEGQVLKADGDGRFSAVAGPPAFDSRIVRLTALEGPGLIVMVDAAQKGVFALDQRSGQRALLLR